MTDDVTLPLRSAAILSPAHYDIMSVNQPRNDVMQLQRSAAILDTMISYLANYVNENDIILGSAYYDIMHANICK